MEIVARVTGLLQRVNLSTGEVENLMELDLGQSVVVTAPITEADADNILRLSVGADVHREAPEQPVWGKDLLDVPLPSMAPISSMPEIDPPILGQVATNSRAHLPSNVRTVSYYAGSNYRGGGPKDRKDVQPPPAITVPMDEYGNPIVQGSFITLDEDGVPSA